MKYKDYSDDWFVFENTRFLPQTNIDRKKHEYVKSGQTDTAKFFLMVSNRMGYSIDAM